MKCPDCAYSVLPDQRFCPSCGKSLNKCPKCGHSSVISSQVCEKCGSGIELSQSISAETQNPVEISVPLPKIEKIEEALLRHATVLFADIKGSTSLIEALDPEEARNISLPIVKEMLNAVYSYGGTVVHTAGDGIVVIFGAPKSFEDHALRACFAALSMQAKVKTVNPEIQIRVGLNSGKVLLEVVGSDKHLEYDIAGPVVNLAARMEQTAKPGTIQITGNTLKLVEKNAQIVPLGIVPVKGFENPIDIFELTAIHEVKLTQESKKQYSRIPFVSRENEMAIIFDALEKAKSSQGQIISISAKAGQGKSRLIYELTHSEIAKGCHISVSGGFSHTSSIPLFPIIKLFNVLFETDSEENKAKQENKIQEILADIDIPFKANAARTLLGMKEEDVEWNQLPPPLRHKHLFEVGVKILIQFAQKAPQIIIVEDLHWIDSETQAFLDLLLPAINLAPILLILNYRPEYRNRWVNYPNHQVLELSPLQKKGEEIIIDSLLGSDLSLKEIKEKLLINCGGNPFFIEEMVKSLISKGLLIGTVGNYKLNSNALVQSMQLPETIFAVLQTQFDQLSVEQKKILQMGAVLGQRFTHALISQLMEMDQTKLKTLMQELSEVQFIEEVPNHFETEYTFKHALIQEVVYSGLLKAAKRTLHLKIMSVFESNPEKDLQQTQLMANHAFLGENWEKAFKYSKESAAISFLMNALESSLHFYNQALTSAKQLNRDKELAEDLTFIHLELCQIFVRLGQFEKQIPHLEATMKLAKETSSQLIECKATSWYGFHYLGMFNPRKALEYSKRAYTLAKELKDLDSLLSAQFALVHALLFLGQYEELCSIGDELIATLPEPGYIPDVVRIPVGYMTLIFCGMGGSYLGHFRDSEKEIERIISSDALKQHSIETMATNHALGFVLLTQQKDLERAIQHLLYAVNSAIDFGFVVNFTFAAAPLGCAYLRHGNVIEGRKYIEFAVKYARDLHLEFVTCTVLDYLCEGLLLLEEFQEARTLTDELLQFARKAELNGQIASLLRISAEIDLHSPQPNFKKIKQDLDESMLMAFSLLMKPLQGHCYLALAKFYQHTGDMSEREKALKSALKIYQELDMPYWVNQCGQIRPVNQVGVDPMIKNYGLK